MSLQLPLDAESLIPHRLPMRLIDRLISISDNSGVVEARVRPDCPLVDENGCLEDVALIEIIAQSYASLKGYIDRVENKPVRRGYLVGIKKLAKLKSVRVDDRLRIEIETLAELDDLAIAEGRVWRGEYLVARGEIKAWIN